MSGATGITFVAEVYQAIVADCPARYPNEACGILIGQDDAGGRAVVQWRLALNVWDTPQEHGHRFRIDPAAQLAAEREARAAGLEVVGFYHSHPDAPPKPSPRDVEAAWPFYTYLIIQTAAAGESMPAACWIFEETHQVFRRQAMSIAASL